MAVISVLIALFVYDVICSVAAKIAEYLRERNKYFIQNQIKRKEKPLTNPHKLSLEMNSALFKALPIILKNQFPNPISEVHAMDRNNPDLPDKMELFQRLQAYHEKLGITLMPIMDRKTFAKTVGITDHTLTKLISREYIPAVKFDNGIKNSRFSPVNVAALWTSCLEQAREWQARQGD